MCINPNDINYTLTCSQLVLPLNPHLPLRSPIKRLKSARVKNHVPPKPSLPLQQDQTIADRQVGGVGLQQAWAGPQIPPLLGLTLLRLLLSLTPRVFPAPPPVRNYLPLPTIVFPLA